MWRISKYFQVNSSKGWQYSSRFFLIATVVIVMTPVNDKLSGNILLSLWRPEPWINSIQLFSSSILILVMVLVRLLCVRAPLDLNPRCTLFYTDTKEEWFQPLSHHCKLCHPPKIFRLIDRLHEHHWTTHRRWCCNVCHHLSRLHSGFHGCAVCGCRYSKKQQERLRE
jgi:hypothetical protein